VSHITVAVLASFAAAACFAVTSVLQHRATWQVAAQPAMQPRIFVDLAHRPMWLVGVLTDAAGFGLQVLALSAGPVSLVQPLLVIGLPIAVLLSAGVDRRLPYRVELVGAALAAGGLAAFLLVANPSAGNDEPADKVAVGWGNAAVIVTAGCLYYASRHPGPTRAVTLAVATGVLYGVTAALVKITIGYFQRTEADALLAWPLYALIVVGGAGYLLNQNAFQAGELPAPLATLTVLDPVVAIAAGASALGEGIATDGLAPYVEAAALGAMVMGVVLLSRFAERVEAETRPEDRAPARAGAGEHDGSTAD
jgi:drug/metabolite transporter (DMT)-like permease